MYATILRRVKVEYVVEWKRISCKSTGVDLIRIQMLRLY